MRLALLTLALPSLLHAAPLSVTFGPSGEVTSLAVGDVPYCTDLALTVSKPGWDGSVLDQRSPVPGTLRAREAGDVTTYTATLQGEGVRARFRETVRVSPDQVSLHYELTPDRAVPIERVYLNPQIPAGVHAGKTRYVLADAGLPQGLLPAERDPLTHIIVGARAADWCGLSGPGETALRVTPSGLTMQLQDARRWDIPAFGLLMTSAVTCLTPGRTIAFSLTLTARSAAGMQADVALLAASDLASYPRPDSRPLAIQRLVADRDRVPARYLAEVSADIAATYDNPFDPDQIAVDAHITGPRGETLTVPAFYLVPVAFETRLGSERARVAGPPEFRVRFTPPAPGRYRLVLTATDRTGTVTSAPLTIVATPSAHTAFVRRAAASPAYFALDDGSPFVPVGENMAWAAGPAPLADYARWLQGLGDAGGNWARLFLSHGEKGQEWSAPPTERPGVGTYLGLGRYAQDNAARLDQVFRLAELSGVRLMLCIGSFYEFTQGGFFNEGCWVSNPYNAANGGPCATPDDFWTDPAARRLYRQRLRYLIARWGYSTSLFAWEFWNEVPATPAEEAWVTEMAACLKRTDPYRHLVSTTYGKDATWQCPAVDFSMDHLYGQANIADFAPQIQAMTADHLRFGKPYLPAEFGIDWQTGDERWDPAGTGLNMHNGAWAALMSGAAGTTMLWYWDSYVEPRNLYHVLSPVRAFADTVDWAHTRFAPLTGLRLRPPVAETEVLTDLTVPATVEWGITPSADITVCRDGSVLGGPIAVTLASPHRGNPGELHTRLTWHLDMPRAGRVVARLGQVASAARLQVLLDGKLVVDRPLATGAPGEGPWQSSRFLSQYGIWVSNYDLDIPVEVPAGPHELTFANAEGDWLQIRSLALPAYRSSRFPDVNALGLTSDRLVLLWLQNRQSNWRTEHQGRAPATLKGLRLTVPVPAPGTWRVQWWDTFAGTVQATEEVRAARGSLRLRVPSLQRDLAARIAPVG
jgi:hypothetical protein